MLGAVLIISLGKANNEARLSSHNDNTSLTLIDDCGISADLGGEVIFVRDI